MTRRSAPWVHGVPCWFDISVSDLDRARPFYEGILGWSFASAVDGFAVGLVDGRAAGGIGTAGPPGQVLLHVAADDADAAVEAALGAGGTVILPAGGVGENGRMAVLADPCGLPFAVWQAGSQIGAEVTSEPGALVWEDLRSPDPDASRAFFAAVFGWRYEELPFPGAEGYTTFHLSPDRAGADAPQHPLGGIGPVWGVPGWRVYVQVADPDAATAAAAGLGGAVTEEPKDTPFGRIGEVTDPDGARLAVMSTQGPDPAWN